MQSTHEVRRAIEDLLCKTFNCDSFLVQSVDEYHCNQRNKAATLRANVSTYYAKDRVDQFYSYLRTEQVSIFDGSVEVNVSEGISTPGPDPRSDSSMVYVYVVVIVLFCGIVTFVIMISTILGIRKFRKKSLKYIDDNRPGSSARNVLRSHNCDTEDCSLSRSPVSPIPLSSSVLACSPNQAHTHTPHNIDIPPHSSNDTQTSHSSNSNYPEEIVSLHHQVTSSDSAGISLQPCDLNQDFPLLSIGSNVQSGVMRSLEAKPSPDLTISSANLRILDPIGQGMLE